MMTRHHQSPSMLYAVPVYFWVMLTEPHDAHVDLAGQLGLQCICWIRSASSQRWAPFIS